MRPVTIPDPTMLVPNYPFHTVASLMAAVNSLNFAAGGVVAKAFNPPVGAGGVTRTISQLQNDLLLLQTGGNPFSPMSTVGQRNAAKKRIKDRLALVYRQARPHLNSFVGQYCSFCELPILNQPHIEHMVPKGRYPLRTVWWDNFLLACAKCNSSKGQKPTRANAIAWATTAAVPMPNETQIMDAAENHYFWPHINTNAYERTKYKLMRITNNGTYYNIPLGNGSRATNPNNNIPPNGAQNNRVNANIQATTAAALSLRRVEATIDPKIWPGAANAILNATTTETLNLTGLTIRGSTRSFYRTIAWFRVLSLIRNWLSALATLPAGAPNAVKLQVFTTVFWRPLLLMAPTVGFYSTFVTVLKQFVLPAYVPNPAIPAIAPTAGFTLAHKFVYDSIPGHTFGSLMTIPGTDINGIP